MEKKVAVAVAETVKTVRDKNNVLPTTKVVG
jgi:hypothetical protein